MNLNEKNVTPEITWKFLLHKALESSYKIPRPTKYTMKYRHLRNPKSWVDFQTTGLMNIRAGGKNRDMES